MKYICKNVVINVQLNIHVRGWCSIVWSISCLALAAQGWVMGDLLHFRIIIQFKLSFFRVAGKVRL